MKTEMKPKNQQVAKPKIHLWLSLNARIIYLLLQNFMFVDTDKCSSKELPTRSFEIQETQKRKSSDTEGAMLPTKSLKKKQEGVPV